MVETCVGQRGPITPATPQGKKKLEMPLSWFTVHSKNMCVFPELPSGYGVYVKPAGHFSSCVSNRVPVAWQ